MINLNRPIEISKLSLDEKIDLVEALWKHIAEEAGGIALAHAQKAELDRRLEAYRADPERGSSLGGSSRQARIAMSRWFPFVVHGHLEDD